MTFPINWDTLHHHEWICHRPATSLLSPSIKLSSEFLVNLGTRSSRWLPVEVLEQPTQPFATDNLTVAFGPYASGGALSSA